MLVYKISGINLSIRSEVESDKVYSYVYCKTNYSFSIIFKEGGDKNFSCEYSDFLKIHTIIQDKGLDSALLYIYYNLREIK